MKIVKVRLHLDEDFNGDLIWKASVKYESGRVCRYDTLGENKIPKTVRQFCDQCSRDGRYREYKYINPVGDAFGGIVYG